MTAIRIHDETAKQTDGLHIDRDDDCACYRGHIGIDRPTYDAGHVDQLTGKTDNRSF